MPAATAVRLFARAGISLDASAGVGFLALALMGPISLVRVPGLGPVWLERAPARIMCPIGMPEKALALGIALAIAAWAEDEDAREHAATFEADLAEELLLPMGPFRKAADRLRGRVRALSDEFVVPETIVENRLAKVGGPRRVNGEYQRFRHVS